MNGTNGTANSNAYCSAEREAIYRVIRERRDMRHFTPGSIEPEVLARLLNAAHQAPSVGLMQPWRFIRISSTELRTAIYQLVAKERDATADALGERSSEFLRLKVEGINDCAEVIVAALMDQREPHIFGRRTLPQMDLASVSCAIQNLWLAARAEGLGMGWVSMFDPEALAALLKLPAGAEPVGILCLGQVEKFYDAPMLAEEGWSDIAEANSVMFEDEWDKPLSLTHSQKNPNDSDNPS